MSLGRRRPRMRAALLVPVLVALSVPVAVVFASPAAALCTGTGSTTICLPPPSVGDVVSKADKTFQPAGALVSLAGLVLPQASAQSVTLASLDQYAEGNSDGGAITSALDIANYVPGFKLGFKTGGYISDWIGLGEPAPAYVPYSGEDIPTQTTGWVGQTFPKSGTTANGTVFKDFQPIIDESKFPFGGQITYGTNSASPIFESINITNYTGFTMPVLSATVYCKNGTTGAVGTGAAAGAVFTTGNGSLGIPINGTGGYSNLTQGGTFKIGMSSTDNQAYCRTGDGATFDHLDVSLQMENINYGVVGTWYPAGHASRPASTSSTPKRVFQMRATCLGANGTTTNNDKVSNEFVESTTANYPKPPSPVCPSGSQLVGWRLTLNDAVLFNQLKVIKTWAMPAKVLENLQSQPLCVTDAKCGTTLWHVRPGSNETVDCFTVGNECAEWATDPNRATNYLCTYGQGKAPGTDKSLDISECFQYGPTFNPVKRQKGIKYGAPGVDPNPATDKSPSTRPGGANASQPVNAPIKVGDPAGEPDSNGNPGPKPSSGPTAGGGCNWGDAFSLNPVDWVVVPLKCLFIPRTEVVGKSVSDAWATMSTRPPISLVTAVVPVVQGFTGAALRGCGPNLANFGDGLVIPCAPPGSPAWHAAMYLVLQIAIAGFTAFGLWRIVGDGLKK